MVSMWCLGLDRQTDTHTEIYTHIHTHINKTDLYATHKSLLFFTNTSVLGVTYFSKGHNFPPTLTVKF